MSYCRFSSNDFQSDVYVYADVQGGYTTHVAASRIVFPEPLPPPIEFNQYRVREWLERDDTVMRLIEAGRHEMIDLPHAGASFNDATPRECADRLESLRALGYRVPDFAIASLREEAEAETGTPSPAQHQCAARA